MGQCSSQQEKEIVSSPERDSIHRSPSNGTGRVLSLVDLAETDSHVDDYISQGQQSAQSRKYREINAVDEVEPAAAAAAAVNSSTREPLFLPTSSTSNRPVEVGNSTKRANAPPRSKETPTGRGRVVANPNPDPTPLVAKSVVEASSSKVKIPTVSGAKNSYRGAISNKNNNQKATQEMAAAPYEAVDDPVPYVFCSTVLPSFLLSFLVCDVSVCLSLSIYYRLPAFSDTTRHESNHQSSPPPQPIYRIMILTTLQVQCERRPTVTASATPGRRRGMVTQRQQHRHHHLAQSSSRSCSSYC
jgi:hypothetical protein